MNFIKNTFIKLSPHKDLYIDLLKNNCLHNKSDNFYNDEILRDALFS